MLTELRIGKFKAFGADATLVPLTPYALIAGRNGAGKTSVLQALELLGMLARGTIGDAMRHRSWAYEDLVHLKSDDSLMEFEASVELGGAAYVWSLTLGKRLHPGVAGERVTVDGRTLMERQGRTMWRYDADGSEADRITQTLGSSWLAAVDGDDFDRFPELLALQRWAAGIRPYLVLDPLILREPASAVDGGIGTHGEGMAAFYAQLDEAGRDRVVARVQEHYPQLRRAAASSSGDSAESAIQLDESWGTQHELSFSARQVSDGLLRLLTLSLLHELPERPSMLLIDEVENGVHPRLLRSIVEMLRALAETGVQVVATTHSPVALSYVGSAAEVVLVDRDDHGSTRVMRLSDSPKWPTLSKAFAPGEALFAIGEDDLFGS